MNNIDETDASKVNNDTKVEHPSDRSWKATPLPVWIGLGISILANAASIPGWINDLRELGDGPNITVSAETGPFESPNTKPGSSPDLSQMTSFTKLVIGNDGNQPATDVAIQWQGRGYASIMDIDGNSNSSEFSNRLALGKLPIGATYTVKLWTENQHDDSNISPPSISHFNGSRRMIEHQVHPAVLIAAIVAVTIISLLFMTINILFMLNVLRRIRRTVIAATERIKDAVN